MADVRVLVVRTGVANLASVLTGLKRAGAKAELCIDPEAIGSARAVVLPGVGAFGAGMKSLRKTGMVQALKSRIEQRLPTLAVCLGLQLLCASSRESPGETGLGIIDLPVGRFTDKVRVPQLGWNKVEPEPGCKLLEEGYAFFANSFRLDRAPDNWNAAYSDYDGPFAAALESGPVLACQFHPELSGSWGRALIRRWLKCAGGRPC